MTKKTKKTENEVAPVIVEYMPPQLPVEAKLTKGEIIDLLIEQMEKDLGSERVRLEAELTLAMKIPWEEMLEAILAGNITMPASVGLRFSYTDEPPGVSLNDVKLNRDGRPFKERYERAKKISAEKDRVSALIWQLSSNRTAAKNVILRQFLEQSPEGRDVLDQLGKFRVGLQARLLEAVEKEKK